MNVQPDQHWPWTRLIVILLVIISGSVGCTTPIQRQIEVYPEPDAEEYAYLLYLPDGYEASAAEGTKWPTIIFLHGIMEKGEKLSSITTNGLPRLVERNLKIPFIVISPQIVGGDWDSRRVILTLESAAEQHRVDPDRVYLTGHSLGGAATYQVASDYPEVFAAIVPISAWGSREAGEKLGGVPVWAWHGGADFFVPILLHQPAIDGVRAAGGEARLTVVANLHHIANDIYSKPELYDWLLLQPK